MTLRQRPLVVSLCLVAQLAACGGAPERQRLVEPTIASLATAPAVEQPVLEALPDARQRAVSAYRQLLAQPVDSAAGSDDEVRRRLADLQVELASDGGAADAARYREAIDLYRGLLAQQPSDERAVAIRYQLAKALALAGQGDAARAELDALAAAHPEAEGSDEVQFRRGEMHFGNDDSQRAEQAYSAVLARGESSNFYPRALYKRGWARFKHSDYRGAERDFSDLLGRGLGARTDGDAALAALPRAERELLGDALRAMALSFGYEGGAGAADTHFEGQPQAWEDLLYATLAEQAIEKQQYAEAAAANAAFVARHPQSRRAPFFQSRLVEAYAEAGFDREQLQAKRDYVALYEAHASGWDYAEPARGSEVDGRLESYLHQLASHHHALAQQAEKPDSDAAREQRAEAIGWYRSYVKHFPAGERSAPMNFQLAEALFEQRDFRAAAAEYQHAAYDYPDFARGGEAAYAALLAFEEHQQSLPALPERGAGRPDPTAVDWRLSAIDSALKFAEHYPDHPQLPTVLTRSAEDLYRIGEDPLARRVAREVIDSPAADDGLRSKAWRVAANVDFEAGRHAEAEAGYGELLALLPAEDAERGAIDELRAASIYRQAEAARETGELRAAVAHFLRVGSVVPASPIRATASYDAAALLYSAAGEGQAEWAEAAELLQRFRAEHGEHELAADAGRKLALAYQNGGDSALAATEFRRLGREDGDPELRAEAARQSAALYEASGERVEAIAQYTEVLAQHRPDFSESLALHEKLLALNVDAEDAAAVRGWRESLIALDGSAGEARSDRSRQLAADAALALAQPTLAAYYAVQLSAPIEQSLPAKQQRLEAALAAYARAAEYGLLPVASEATFRVGELYGSFAAALMGAQRPAGLSELELEQYEVLLEEQAFPFEEEAIAAHEVNTARLPDGVWDEWIRGSLAELSELLPARYRKQERGAVYVDALD